MKKHSIAASLAGAALSAACLPATGADWADNSVGYRYGTKFQEPANPKDIKKHIFNFTHASGYKYGGNFFTVDVLMSDRNDPAAPIQAPETGPGAQEIYLVYAHTLSLSKTTGSPGFKFGPVRDVGITVRFDFNTKNDAFAPRVRKFMGGPTVSFDVPGFFDVGLWYYKEKNHNGIVPLIGSPPGMTDDVSFDATYRIALAWGIPIPAIGAKFSGFLTYTGEKGKDGFGADTKPETLTDMYLLFDVGAFFGKKDTFFVGPGVEYWRNKFGSPANEGADYTAPMIAAEIHF